MPDTGILIDEDHIIQIIIETGEYHLILSVTTDY